MQQYVMQYGVFILPLNKLCSSSSKLSKFKGMNMGPRRGSDLFEYGKASGSWGIGIICKPHVCAFLAQPRS